MILICGDVFLDRGVPPLRDSLRQRLFQHLSIALGRGAEPCPKTRHDANNKITATNNDPRNRLIAHLHLSRKNRYVSCALIEAKV